MDESTYEWEALTTSVHWLSKNKLVQSYVGKLKPHIQNELKMHQFLCMEKVKLKEKVVESKLES